MKAAKTLIMGFSGALVLTMTSLTANGDIYTYSGTIGPSTLGGSVATDLPQFNSALGTLTAVQITLDFTVDPYASVLNISGGPLTFDPASWTSESFSPSVGNWTVTYGSDSWGLTAPTVGTGNIFGTGQVVGNFNTLSFPGGTTAPADLTSASGADLPAYIGGGDLTFGVTGPGHFSGGGPWYNGGGGLGGGGADLTGTSSVTYDYVPVPEPAMLALLGLGGLAMLKLRRPRVRVG